MKIRVISGLVAVLLLIAIICLGNIVFSVCIFILTLIAVHELMNAGISGGFRPSKGVSYISCVAVLIAGFNDIYFYISPIKFGLIIMALLYFVIATLLLISVFKFEKFRPQDVGFSLLCVLYPVFMFAFIPLIRNMEGGIYLIWILFIGAWGTDTLAYFSGMFFGRRKIMPLVSPKKTLEGSIGGAIGCMLLTFIYGYFMNNNDILNIPLYHYAIFGLINGILSQTGDWVASALKRHVGIKDYGNLMPGHGGVLDRFDSIIFIAPLFYLYLGIFINN